MCQDCPTARTRARGVAEELASWVVLPFALIGIVLVVAVAGGAITFSDVLQLLR